jgi:hypothetical protein
MPVKSTICAGTPDCDAWCGSSSAPGGLVLLVNWTGTTDTPCTRDEAARLFIAPAASDLHPLRGAVDVTYRLDLLGQTSTQVSVS